ncbi:MAG TPA: exodeoxyribonuclease VII large subunit [Candidatus Nanopelagicales bacterium]|nr:exodeoxyribonuclease VII large subunit [Candidatus Nanopelagicales bacterium]
MSLQTSAEHPAAVRTIAHALVRYVDRLGTVWIEGQVAQLNRRPGARVVFLTLRDTEADMSLSVSASAQLIAAMPAPLVEGQRVVVAAKAQFYPGRGTLTFRATVVRAVGLGELLARLEHLRGVLAAEGLFDADRKRALPFLPRRVGLVCGRASHAERDVVEQAGRRWPGIAFEIREVAVQGVHAVLEVSAAVRELDGREDVDVIVITRGGGSVEDLLPFSDEGLLRVVAAARTPVVSAIGHEKDTPLLDLVADVRASTPTDAARRVVPDMAEQARLVSDLRARSARAVSGRLAQAVGWLTEVRARPVLADPLVMVAGRDDAVAALLSRTRRAFTHRLDRAGDDLAHTTARVRALSPAATLSRGYAVVQRADGSVLRDPEQAPSGTALRIRVSGGELAATAD